MEEKTLLTSERRRGVARKFGAIPKLALLSVTLLVAVSTWIIVFSKPLGGDISPIRVVQDPYPVFYDVAVDAENELVVASDTNRFSLRTYHRGLLSQGVAEPLTIISGPNTAMDFACGVDLDPVSREIYVVNNDTGADLMVFSYDASGDVAPSRLLHAARRGTWGVSVDRIHNEVAVTVEHVNKLAIFHRTAQGDEEPLRVIQGPKTQLADPHGVFLDGANDEIYVANHDSWHAVRTGETEGRDEPEGFTSSRSTGKFVAYSITIYSRTANGDVSPLRMIRGPQTELNLPMKIHLDVIHNEIAVANSGGDSILIFSRAANGNVAPVRIIKGPSTGLDNPTGVYIDSKNDEIWVVSPGTHSLAVYERTADGDVAPLRLIRGAPAGSAAVGIGNPGGITYDPIRKLILVPN